MLILNNLKGTVYKYWPQQRLWISLFVILSRITVIGEWSWGRYCAWMLRWYCVCTLWNVCLRVHVCTIFYTCRGYKGGDNISFQWGQSHNVSATQWLRAVRFVNKYWWILEACCFTKKWKCIIFTFLYFFWSGMIRPFKLRNHCLWSSDDAAKHFSRWKAYYK